MYKEIRKPCYLCFMAEKEKTTSIFKLARTMFPKSHYTIIKQNDNNIKLYTITIDLYFYQCIKLLNEYNKYEKGENHE